MSNLRIISGFLKGKKLVVPEENTRPMTDMAKSALFSKINDYIIKADVLDLYSGTGALGIECLSRGAKSVTFVEKTKEAVFCIQQNLKECGLDELATVIKASVKRFLEEYKTFNLINKTYQIILVTPPYKKYKEKTIENCSKLLDNNGILIAEFPANRKVNERIGELERVDLRVYGKSGLAFFKKQTNV